jgi:hypothetical protein
MQSIRIHPACRSHPKEKPIPRKSEAERAPESAAAALDAHDVSAAGASVTDAG